MIGLTGNVEVADMAGCEILDVGWKSHPHWNDVIGGRIWVRERVSLGNAEGEA